MNFYINPVALQEVFLCIAHIPYESVKTGKHSGSSNTSILFHTPPAERIRNSLDVRRAVFALWKFVGLLMPKRVDEKDGETKRR